MEELEELPDITRITARLLLKLEEGGLDQSEPLPFSLGERSFESLLSHAEKIDDEDLCARQVFYSHQADVLRHGVLVTLQTDLRQVDHQQLRYQRRG